MSKYFLKILFFTLMFLYFFNSEAQTKSSYNKGDIYSYWGWNFSWYSKSDIHFKGDNYDFTIHDATAQDRQTEFSFDNYFNPATIISLNTTSE